MNNDVIVTVQHDGFEPAQVRAFMSANGEVKAYMRYSQNSVALLGQAHGPLPKPKTYYMGQHFTAKGMPYVLAYIDQRTVSLINTDSGLRWGPPVQVSAVFEITEDEFRNIADGSPSDFVEVIK